MPPAELAHPAAAAAVAMRSLPPEPDMVAAGVVVQGSSATWTHVEEISRLGQPL